MGRRSCSSSSIAQRPSRCATSSPRGCATRSGSARCAPACGCPPRGCWRPSCTSRAASWSRRTTSCTPRASCASRRDRRPSWSPYRARRGCRRPTRRRGRRCVDFSIETVDTALFDRRGWLRAYGAALDAAPRARRWRTATRAAVRPARRRSPTTWAGPGRSPPIPATSSSARARSRASARRPAARAAGVRRVALEDPCGDELRAAVAGAGLEPVPLPTDAHGLRGRRAGRRRRRRGVPDARPPVPRRRHAAARAPAGAAAPGPAARTRCSWRTTTTASCATTAARSAPCRASRASG